MTCLNANMLKTQVARINDDIKFVAMVPKYFVVTRKSAINLIASFLVFLFRLQNYCFSCIYASLLLILSLVNVT